MGWADDYNQADEAFKPLPVGSYAVEVKSAKSQPTSNGKPMFKVQFEVLAGPERGRTLWNNFVVSRENPKAMSFFFQHMSVLGLSREFFMSEPSDESVAAKLVGARALVEVQHRDWQGKTRDEVNSIKPLPAGMALPSSNPSVPSNPSIPTTPATSAPQTPQAPPPPAPSPVSADAAEEKTDSDDFGDEPF